ncbi:LAQU0S16e00694g1_1 [Lachancea quebecensis]|uniref:LAQU0S16e00694g1_1 n=1 Tax=Lachancea quebecensis TaxID=1654605 RepID=A0A0P1KVV5_9SACH|nr:LAQU0S16e00694g1_1 [Lachancea quebecensis]
MSSSMPYDPSFEDEKKRQYSYKHRSFLDRVGTTIAQHKRAALGIFCAFFVLFWFGSSRFTIWSKDPKIVLILAVNDGGGVHKWKGEQEWAIERISIQNKRAYAKRHGYGLTLKDMRTARRYSHEYREGWQKVEVLRQTMREFPNAEWFWWLDLETLIMEPQISLEDHIFKRLDSLSYRMLDKFNPLNLPLDIPYVDYSQPPELLITQDCGGFNLGSFLVKNSKWAHLLLDVWWDPVCYEQKHMMWEHREQDALEALYANQPWIREKTAFLPLRSINAFPPGACSEFSDDPRYFYSEEDRDFVVNMAGCAFGRDCWAEIQRYGSLLENHNQKWWRRFY